MRVIWAGLLCLLLAPLESTAGGLMVPLSLPVTCGMDIRDSKMLRKCTSLQVKGGAKKKKKKSADSPVAPAATQSAPARVSTNINVPVRQQIAWAKAYKRFSSGANKSLVTKKFRQEKGEKAAEEEYTEIDYELTQPPAVFVDGYNIIGYINSVEGRSLSLEDSRDCLVSDLCVLKSATGWHIEVVFDAYMTGGAEAVSDVDNVQVIFTSKEETADNYIERKFAALRNGGFTNMVVGTDDRVLQMVAGSNGVGYITASMLVEELRIAYRGWETIEQELATEAKRRRPNIGDGLSPEIRDAIALLKKQRDDARNA